MASRFDPETVDLAALTATLERRCGSFIAGPVVGRTLLRDQLVRELDCSELDAERLVDTLVGRGFVVRQESSTGQPGWALVPRAAE